MTTPVVQFISCAIAALGDYSTRTPDFETTKLTLKTYRTAAKDALSLNKMWLGEGEPVQVDPTPAKCSLNLLSGSA